MSRAAWEAVLTRLEDELDGHEAALRTGVHVEVAAFEPPAELGTVPPELTERVAQLMRRTNLLATFVQYQLIATDADLRFEGRKKQVAGAQALFLDRAV